MFWFYVQLKCSLTMPKRYFGNSPITCLGTIKIQLSISNFHQLAYTFLTKLNDYLVDLRKLIEIQFYNFFGLFLFDLYNVLVMVNGNIGFLSL